jgi:hypothetical protein
LTYYIQHIVTWTLFACFIYVLPLIPFHQTTRTFQLWMGSLEYNRILLACVPLNCVNTEHHMFPVCLFVSCMDQSQMFGSTRTTADITNVISSKAIIILVIVVEATTNAIIPGHFQSELSSSSSSSSTTSRTVRSWGT